MLQMPRMQQCNLVETEATKLETYATGYLVNCNKVKNILGTVKLQVLTRLI